jgi:RNA polymerase sigma-70 factor, ECF subfamily
MENSPAPITDLERLYRDEGARLWRALFAFSKSREIADEARAEAFAQAVRRWNSPPAPTSAAAWVWTSAFRIARGMLQSDPVKQTTLDEVTATTELPPPIDHLVAALAQLPTKQRIAVLLHDYADRPTADIAASMGISVATAYVHISRGRRRLRQILGDAEEVHNEV